jgi:hypothetical protein
MAALQKASGDDQGRRDVAAAFPGCEKEVRQGISDRKPSFRERT